MRIVVALGGNALLRRGQPMTAREPARERPRRGPAAGADRRGATSSSSRTATARRSGCSPSRAAAYEEVETYPLDVLGAQTEGMIGYMIEQELGNLLPFERPFASILTMIEVDPDDPAFADPTKFIGPVYEQEEAERLAAEKGWAIKPDGDKWRRVVASPLPKRIFEIRPIPGCSSRAPS